MKNMNPTVVNGFGTVLVRYLAKKMLVRWLVPLHFRAADQRNGALCWYSGKEEEEPLRAAL